MTDTANGQQVGDRVGLAWPARVIIRSHSVVPLIHAAPGSPFVRTCDDPEAIVSNGRDPATAAADRVLAPHTEQIRYTKENNHMAAGVGDTGVHYSPDQYLASLDSDEIWLATDNVGPANGIP